MVLRTMSRLEVNFSRLLHEAQNIANGNKPKDWTFQKYVEWLQNKIPEMEKSPNAPSEEKLNQYKRQVEFLRSVLDADQCENVLECSSAAQLIPHGPATIDGEVVMQQIHHRAQSKTTLKLRKELLGLDSESDFKKKTVETFLADNFQDQMALEEQRRDKMVEDMIAMTREWKEQSRVAGRVIKKDLETVESSSRIADTNETQLKVESNRLAEFNKRTCNCWIWLMLILICCTFISMVMFIKLFKKKTLAAV